MLLGTVAAGALSLSLPHYARAQVVPPAAPCDNVSGTTVTCAGDVSSGIKTSNPYTTLYVNNLTQDIAPALGVDGIYFNSTGAITINSDTSPFSIMTQNASGIYAKGNGNVTVTQTGNITTQGGVFYFGIYARSNSGNATVTQTGDVTTKGDSSTGIYAYGSAVTITHIGDITTEGGDAFGIGANASSTGTVIQVGNITTKGDSSTGIKAYGFGDHTVTQTGNIITQGSSARGINAFGPRTVTVTQTGNITTKGDYSTGIYAGGSTGTTLTQTGNIMTQGDRADGLEAAGDNVTVAQIGNISTRGYGARGIDAESSHGNATVTQTGNITTQGNTAFGINASSTYRNAMVTQTGDIMTAGNTAFGINASGVKTTVTQTGKITTAGNTAFGIFASATLGKLTVTQAGNITTAGNTAIGINALSTFGNIAVQHTGGNITTQGATAHGIYAFSNLGNITVQHTGGDITASGQNADGIRVRNAFAGNAAVSIGPGSMVQGGTGMGAGIFASSASGATISNAGGIGALSQRAIVVQSGAAKIFNIGTITGYVLLDANDNFINQAGGTFEARQTSDFDAYGPGGNDLFVNQSGATVHTANARGVNETTRFINLETFKNQGMISTVDGGTGDQFIISNTPGGKDLNFVASGNSTLAVDAFLGGPGNSSSDTFTIHGNVSGVTTVQINNLNTGLGVYNPKGVKVVTVTGKTPNANAFQLAQPIDTGFFNYDLFFTPTGSGFWSLKSFPGGGAYVLPQLLTAEQDIWHQSADTWFDRTADLRVLLNGGAAPTAYAPNGAYRQGAPPGTTITPAVWARGSGGWLGRDDSASTTAYGRTYNYNLDRNLQTMDFQMGLDLGKRDVLSEGDALVFGVLGGFVQANLDYSNLVRQFDFSGGQVGAYATYLKGGLFVDTLFNAHLYDLNPNGTLGFPSTLSASTLGVRTDSGYRFGSFTGGPFIEPLATIAVTWTNIDNFSQGGDTVSFNADPNVRGRLGLRLGSTMKAWAGTTMEPFVIESLWGNLSDNNQATLVSNGTTFRFDDNLQGVWDEVSGGVNFFTPSANTTLFAKVDVAFANDLDGVDGKAGMRVVW